MTRANRCSPVSGSRRPTAIESVSVLMYGNGWPGSTASGVRTGIDLVVEALAEGLVMLGDVVVVEDLDALGGELVAQVGEDRRLLGHQLEDARLDRVELLGRGPAVRGDRLRAAQLLAAQARHPHLEELVEVVDEEEQGPDAVEEPVALVARLVEHARVELEPRQLAVEDREAVFPRWPSATAGARCAVRVRGERRSWSSQTTDRARDAGTTAPTTRSRSGRREYHAALIRPMRRPPYRCVGTPRFRPPAPRPQRSARYRRSPVLGSDEHAHLDARRRVDEPLVGRPEPGLREVGLAAARTVALADAHRRPATGSAAAR